MLFKSEFYDNLKRYSVEEIMAAIDFFPLGEQRSIILNWGLNSTKKLNKASYRVFRKIEDVIESGVIYKKPLFLLFPNESEERVIANCNFLKESTRNSLLKLYTLDKNKKEIIEKVDESDRDKIRYAIERIKILLSNEKKCNASKEYLGLNFYELFGVPEKYTKEEVDLVFETLNSYYKAIIFKRYGENLCGFYKITDEEKQVLYFGVNRCMKKGLVKLRLGYKLFSIVDILGHDLNILEDSIDKLDEDDKKYFYSKFNKDLKRKFFSLSLDNNIDGLIEKKYKSKLFYVLERRPIKDFYSRFEGLKLEDESEEEFRERINNALRITVFGEKYLNILFKAFNEDLLGANSDLTSEEKRIITGYIIPRLKNNIINSKPAVYYKSFFERFPIIFSKDDIFFEIENLSLEELNILKTKYGSELKDNVILGTINPKVNRQVKLIRDMMLKRMIKRKSQSTGISRDTLYFIISLVKLVLPQV